jgi:hypothetical protein
MLRPEQGILARAYSFGCVSSWYGCKLTFRRIKSECSHHVNVNERANVEIKQRLTFLCMEITLLSFFTILYGKQILHKICMQCKMIVM